MKKYLVLEDDHSVIRVAACYRDSQEALAFIRKKRELEEQFVEDARKLAVKWKGNATELYKDLWLLKQLYVSKGLAYKYGYDEEILGFSDYSMAECDLEVVHEN